MDRLIKRFDCEQDGDLMICPERGVAYQKDQTHVVSYNKEYFEKCLAYKGNEISEAVISGREKLVRKYHDGDIMDIGVGCGDFVERVKCKGYDVNPFASEWLKKNDLYSEEFDKFRCFTFWDTIEHVSDPEIYFRKIPKDSWIFVSIPTFPETGPNAFLKNIRQSKHYRPDEHLYYWKESGFIAWMAMWGFRALEISNFETNAGRDGISDFVFKKDLPDYNDFVCLYQTMHSTRYYGASASLYLKPMTEMISWLNPASILDYGCGRSDLVAHFYKDGERVLGRYDPAIPEHKDFPSEQFDLALCCDVMEHIPMTGVDRVFSEIKKISDRVIFVISTKPARAKLPNGMNAHVTLLTKSEWVNWVQDYFGKVNIVKTQWNHVLMVKNFG